MRWLRSDLGKRRMIVGLIIIAAIIAYLFYVYGTGFTRTITIAERPPLEKKLVKSTDGDWYEVKDQWLRGVTRSRDTWGDLNVGHTYIIEGYGWRIGLGSLYPNITKIVKTDK